MGGGGRVNEISARNRQENAVKNINAYTTHNLKPNQNNSYPNSN